MERTFGAIDKIANFAYQNNDTGIHNDFDNCYPWNRIEILDEGNERWVRIPKFYSHYELDENGYVVGRAISEYKINDNWFLNPVFKNGDKELNFIDISSYFLSDFNNGKSFRGEKPAKDKKPSEVKSKMTELTNDSANFLWTYELMDFWTLQLLQDLFTIEFNTTDCNSVLKGVGATAIKNNEIVNGVTDELNYVTGAWTKNLENTNYNFKYRGIENLWGCGLTFIDKITFSYSNGYKILIKGDRVDYTTSIPENGTVKKLKYYWPDKLIFPAIGEENATSTYNDRVSGPLRTEDTCLYCGTTSGAEGLFAYVWSIPITSSNEYGVYRVIRKQK